MGTKKHPFTSYLAPKHPKRRKFAITDMREKPVDFFVLRHGRRLTLARTIILPT